MQACIPGYNCSIPIDPGMTWCDLYPNASGCPSSDSNIPIIPPNWGDFDTESLLNFCYCLNSGMYSPQCTITLPSEYQYGWWQALGKKEKHRHSQVVGRDKDGNCNPCPMDGPSDCHIDFLRPSGLGTSRPGHGCPPSTKAHFHIKYLEWSGPWVDPDTNECHCIPFYVEHVECIQDLKEIPAWIIFCPKGYRISRG